MMIVNAFNTLQNHEIIGKHLKRLLKIKRFVNKYNGKEVNYPYR